MKFLDYSPALTPTIDEQKDALKKGLGRAMQWAMAGKLEEAPLLNACLHDLRHDSQIDSSRGDWLWQMIHAIHAEDRFRTSIFDALRNPTECDAQQLCELGFHYAVNGDEAFRSRLYEIVETRPISGEPWIGERQIIQLDQENALLKAARIRGNQLKERSWEWWDDGFLIDEAIDLLGEDRIKRSLETSVDEEIKIFYGLWLEKKRESAVEKSPRIARIEKLKQIKINEIISTAESGPNQFRDFSGWGKLANENDLNTVQQHLIESSNAEIIANYLRVFSKREFHPIIPVIIQLCRHNDEKVRRWAFNALENNCHPLVRQFAEAEFQKGKCDYLILGLFIKNFREGDAKRILEALEIPENECAFHWMLRDIIKMLENNPLADCSQLGVVAYALNPCASCRRDAGRLLYSRNAAPPWMVEECKYDAEPDNRTLVVKV